MRPFARALILVSFASLAAREARADLTKEQCIDANGRGQVLRHDGKLSAARAELRSCVSPSCPAMVRDDCARRLDELDRAQPSVVFEVKDGAGADVIDVRVSMDGELLAEHLDGTPLRVEPGVHVFSFEAVGHLAVTDRMLVREGEAGRHERVTVDGGAASVPSARPRPVPRCRRRHRPPSRRAPVVSAPARASGSRSEAPASWDSASGRPSAGSRARRGAARRARAGATRAPARTSRAAPPTARLR